MLAPQPLCHVIYHSLATSEGMSPEALAALLRQARAYNHGHRFPDWRMGFAPAASQDLRTTTGYFALVPEPDYAHLTWPGTHPGSCAGSWAASPRRWRRTGVWSG